MSVEVDVETVPNRYLPSALTDMVEERHEALLDGQGKDDDTENYVPEYEALVRMLKPHHQEEYRERRGESDDGV